MLRPLNVLRDELNEIDRQIVALFEKRMNIATEVVKFKVENHKPIYDPERERQVIENRVALLANPRFAPYVTALFEDLMDMSKAEQQAYLDTLAPSDAMACWQNTGFPSSASSICTSNSACSG